MEGKDKDKKYIKFKGTVIRDVYTSERFSVYAMDVDANKYPEPRVNKFNNVSICGEIPALTKGVEYEVVGAEEEGKNGISYRVYSIRRDEPLTKQGVRSFLEEITSPNLAYVISEAYPDIIERVKKDRLDDIDFSKMHGVGEKSFEVIVNKINDNFYLSDLAAEFGGILTTNMLRRIYAKYKSVDLLKEKLKKAPYSTLTKVSGIGFKTADDKIIAMQDEGILDFGFDIKTSTDRCLSCIVYLLKQNEDNEGNTKMNLVELRKQVINMTPSCADRFTEAISDDSIYYDKNRLEIALRKTHDREQDIADKVFNNLHNDNVWECDAEKYRNVGDFDLSDEQLSVVDMICENNICILNGFAGSGKTASTKAVINMLEDKDKTYILMSPTGKAAKVLSELTGRHASTIHRALGYNGKEWCLNKYNNIYADIIIVDEVSMVDVNLFWHLLDAIDFARTKLLMIGDNAQLPSVGCGNLLHDFMASKLIPTVTLTKIFRYGDGGLMKVATDVRMGRSYLDGSMKGGVTPFGDSKDYVFTDMPSEKTVQNAVAVYKKLLDKGNSVEDVQVITAKNVGEYGTVKLNSMLQKVANPNYGSNNFFKCGEELYFIGDLVIECANNYKAPLSPSYMSKDELIANINDVMGLGFASKDEEDKKNALEEFDMEKMIRNDKWPTAFVANGETGIIKQIGKNVVDIDFDGIVVRYSMEMMNLIKLGYAITCHKSQGSSINNVILLTPQSDIFMLNSNLLYVGCTRARNKCLHLGSVDTVNKVIKKKANLTRHTFMQQMLKELSVMEKTCSIIDEE